MKIQDFTDMDAFESIMENWAKSTGLATVAVGADGEYISECYNFTDFCIKYTRGSKEGCARCEKCDREGKGVYHCHAGLVDFGIDLVVDGQVLGSVIGGQVLTFKPTAEDEANFRKVAREIGVTPQTAAKYRDDPVLQEMLADRRMEFIRSATGRMQMFLDEGVQILQNIIRDKGVSPQTKVNGIQILFNQCKVWTEQTDILERLRALEEAEKQ